MSSTPSGVRRCSRSPVDSEFAPSGRFSNFSQISRPSARILSSPSSGGNLSISLSSSISLGSLVTRHDWIDTTSSPLSEKLGVASSGGVPMKPTLVPGSSTAGLVAKVRSVVIGASVTGAVPDATPVLTGPGSDPPPVSSSARGGKHESSGDDGHGGRRRGGAQPAVEVVRGFGRCRFGAGLGAHFCNATGRLPVLERRTSEVSRVEALEDSEGGGVDDPQAAVGGGDAVGAEGLDRGGDLERGGVDDEHVEMVAVLGGEVVRGAVVSAQSTLSGGRGRVSP
jgi:hypothetical protein